MEIKRSDKAIEESKSVLDDMNKILFGLNYHRKPIYQGTVDRAVTEKRRKKNKAARTARKVNR